MAVRDIQNTRVIRPNLGLNDAQREGVAELLTRALADQHVLYMKLRNYHWNVTGPEFHALHETFEEQYDAIAGFIDDTAERIRTYGAFAPGTFAEMIQLSALREEPGEIPNARTMIENLVADHETIIRSLREWQPQTVEQFNDPAVEDYFIALIQEHQEMAWMLRAFLNGDGIGRS